MSIMQKKEIKLSKRTQAIIAWCFIIGTVLLLGIMGFSTMGTKSLTKNDYQEIEIIYGRITTTSGEDPMYIIFSKNDEKGFLIDNIVSGTFNKTQFNEQVSAGDKIILTVLKSDYASETTRIETLGVKNDNAVFMDYERAFNKRVNNGVWGYYMTLILLPLSGVLTIAFLIWLLLYNKGIIGKKKTSDERLDIKTNGNIIVIKFPVSIATIIIYCFTFLCGIGLPFFFINNLHANNLQAFIALVVFCGIITVFNVASFVMLFFRKLTISKEKKTLEYFSYFKRTFRIDEVLTLDTKIDDDGEGSTNYYLIIGTCSKNIKVKTQSDEQSKMLRDEILALKNSSE